MKKLKFPNWIFFSLTDNCGGGSDRHHKDMYIGVCDDYFYANSVCLRVCMWKRGNLCDLSNFFLVKEIWKGGARRINDRQCFRVFTVVWTVSSAQVSLDVLCSALKSVEFFCSSSIHLFSFVKKNVNFFFYQWF